MNLSEPSLNVKEEATFNNFQQFLIFCSGAERGILLQCPTEVNKYCIIGASVFITSFAASLSGTYAFFKVFNDLAAAIPLGILWGIIIFNTDRAIVSSIRKPGEGQTTNWGLTLVTTLFRLSIAVLISFVIEVPFELHIFSQSLQAQRAEMSQLEKGQQAKLIEEKYKLPDLLKDYHANQLRNDELNKKIGQKPTTPQYRSLQRDSGINAQALNNITQKNQPSITQLSAGVMRNQNLLSNPKDSLNFPAYRKTIEDLQRQSKVLSGQISSARTTLEHTQNQMLAEYNRVETERQAQSKQLNSKLTQAETEKTKLNGLVAKDTLAVDKQIDPKFSDNLASDLKALNDLKDGTGGAGYQSTSWGIKTIIILIELLPLIIKLFSERGPYDEKIETIEHDAMTEGKKQRKINDAELAKIETSNGELINVRFQAELRNETLMAGEREKIVQNALGKISSFHNLLVNKYIAAWYKMENAKVDGNTYLFEREARMEVPPLFAGILWATLNGEKATYFFSLEKTPSNHQELIYTINGKQIPAFWDYNPINDEVVIRHSDKQEYYLVTLLAEENTMLTLKNQVTREELVLKKMA